MDRGIRLIKRMVALFLVLLLSIESFAAVVSDNDGSAFITKAEFDSLKNNFQSQLDSYNTSIDNKIDNNLIEQCQKFREDILIGNEQIDFQLHKTTGFGQTHSKKTLPILDYLRQNSFKIKK